MNDATIYRPTVTVEGGQVTLTRWADAGQLADAINAATEDGTYTLTDAGWELAR